MIMTSTLELAMSHDDARSTYLSKSKGDDPRECRLVVIYDSSRNIPLFQTIMQSKPLPKRY